MKRIRMQYITRYSDNVTLVPIVELSNKRKIIHSPFQIRSDLVTKLSESRYQNMKR